MMAEQNSNFSIEELKRLSHFALLAGQFDLA